MVPMQGIDVQPVERGAGLPQSLVLPLVPRRAMGPTVRRRLSQEGGRALEILGHAIEYLADEYALDLEKGGRLGCGDPRIEAIQMLKGLNRAVYFEGSELQPVLRRMRRWLSGLRA
jgi:hypothetical protein